MLLAINCPLCTHSISKTTGTNYLLYETLNILAYMPHIYNNHFSLANHAKYDILIRYLQKHIWRRIEVVITGRTRNALALLGHVGSNPTVSAHKKPIICENRLSAFRFRKMCKICVYFPEKCVTSPAGSA